MPTTRVKAFTRSFAAAVVCLIAATSVSSVAASADARAHQLIVKASSPTSFTGELIAAGGTSTGLDGNLLGSYTVTRGDGAVTLVISSQTKLANEGNSLPVTELLYGDRLQVQGSYDSAKNTVSATKVTVIPFATVTFTGSIVALGSSAIGVDGEPQESYSVTRAKSSVTVVVSSATLLTEQGATLPVSALVVGDRLQVQGRDNTSDNTITATSITVIPFPTINFSGSLIAVLPSASGVNSKVQGSYSVTRGNGSVTVVVSYKTVLSNQGSSLPVTALVAGDRLQVQGDDNAMASTIAATKITVLPFPTVSFAGELLTANGAATGLDGNMQGSYIVTRGNSSVTVVISAQTKLATQGNSLPVEQLTFGDRLEVQGGDDTATNTITATKITLIPFPTVNFTGEIISVGASATGLDGKPQASYSVTHGNSSITVVVSSETVLANQGNSLPVSGLVVGERLEVQGSDNTATHAIAASKITVIPFPTINFTGELLAVVPSASGVDGNVQGRYTITRGNNSATLVISAQTKLANQGNALPVNGLVVGERLQVQGSDNAATNTVTATSVTVIPFPTVNFTGELISANGTATGLGGNVQGTYTVARAGHAVTVVVSSATVLTNQSQSLPVNELLIGDLLQVQGSDDTVTNVVTATRITVVRTRPSSTGVSGST